MEEHGEEGAEVRILAHAGRSISHLYMSRFSWENNWAVSHSHDCQVRLLYYSTPGLIAGLQKSHILLHTGV